MEQIKVGICRMYPDVEIPVYQTNGSAGCDVKAYLNGLPFGGYTLEENGIRQIIICASGIKLIPTGLKFSIPDGYEMQIRPRSGISSKTKIRIANSPGTLDSDYRGELMIIMENIEDRESMGSYRINHGDRIAQLIFAPVVQAHFEIKEFLDETKRGSGGFGSTGQK